MNETNNWAERTTRAALSGCKKGKSRPTSGGGSGRAFLFLYFLKTFFTEIYFRFHILQFCTPTARQGGGRDLHVNKYKLFLRGGPWWEPAAPLPGGRHLPPSGGAAGSLPPSRQGGGRLPPNIKAEPLLSHPHFLPTRSREGRGREEG